ncbi:MAG: transglycosylase SLT domain-containing protein, partial [Myxococcota bacterium]|nr:transglycosylase SLT domain-containing protein [Myxococcota bacterium]
MIRTHVVALALASLSLLSDGRDGRVGTRESAPAQAMRSKTFGVVQVSAYLVRLNPDLRAPEREQIAAAVVKYSAKYRLEPSLVLAVITAESSARPWVRSSKGAVGLMQVMPHVVGGLPVAGNLTSIETNIEAGCLILADNIRRLGEDRGILAYFWGNDIRGEAYLENVRAVRAAILRH